MEKLKRSLSFRKKKDHVPESSKPHQWQEDERKVREGTCSFQVRYLGCIEVFESRGMQVCEDAVKALKARQNRSVWSRMSLRRKKKKKDEQCKGKYQRAVLYVSGDALRVVDEISKGLIVDQTIEKVSFCAPDRNHEKGFAYICRDGTTRRWMCHGFLALKESGERLSHAVGCAFAICLEKKQKREKDAVTVQYNEKGTSFARTGSFRQASLTERLADPQSTIIAEPVPKAQGLSNYAVQRPKATDAMLMRQGSFRGFEKLSEQSPFKRQLSLRLNELPSTVQRREGLNGPSNEPIPEVSPTKEEAPASISAMCQELTQGLSALTTDDDDVFARAPQSPPQSAPPGGTMMSSAAVSTTQTQQTISYTTQQGQSIPLPNPIRQNNPWTPESSPAPTPAPAVSAAPAPAPAAPAQPRVPHGHQRTASDADEWLSQTATILKQNAMVHQQQQHMWPSPQGPGMVNGSPAGPPGPGMQRPVMHPQDAYMMRQSPAGAPGVYHHPAAALHQKAPHLAQLRTHSIDNSDMWAGHQQQARHPMLGQLAAQGNVPHFQSQQNGTSGWHPTSPPTSAPQGPDPFDAAWAAKGRQQSGANPFQAGDTVTKAFTVDL